MLYVYLFVLYLLLLEVSYLCLSVNVSSHLSMACVHVANLNLQFNTELEWHSWLIDYHLVACHWRKGKAVLKFSLENKVHATIELTTLDIT